MRLLLLLAAAALAQAQQPKLISPKVDAERRVTFRLHAPAAQAVKLWGEWILSFNTLEEMVRGDDGTWTATVGPLAPGLYRYVFNLDGVPAPDPNNPLRPAGPYSIFEVADGRSALYEPRETPHGEIHWHWRDSPVAGRRSIVVYTPPNYREAPETRYPVLYLLHGSGGEAMDWITVGRANVILDNLLAAGQVRPMIVVMPEVDPKGIDEYLMNEVISFAEKRYRAAGERTARAIAGQSMGGFLALALWVNHADSFSGVGIFGAGAHGEEGKRQVEGRLSDSNRLSYPPDVFWIGMGDRDILRKDAEQLDELLSRYEIGHRYRIAKDQGHTWLFWRMCLSEFVPLLFRGDD